MIKNIAWNAFKNTGNLDTFLELRQIQNLEQDIQKVEQNGKYKNEWDNNSSK